MKNNAFLAIALLFTAAAGAQTTTTGSTATTPVTTTTVVNADALKGLKVENIRPEHSFPALGSYKASGTSTADVTLTLDETNKGIVWVEGLPQGRFKALMKKAPSTYKIPAQKTESGKAVAEGTLFFNPESKELTIVLGRSFNDEDPTSFLTSDDKAKSKSKAWRYTGIKADATVTTTPPATQQ